MREKTNRISRCLAKVTLACVVGAAEIWLALPAPLAAAPVEEEIVSFRTHDGLTLEGILSYPSRGDGPFPVLLLIPGRGVRDADVTLEHPLLTRGRQKLFQRMARYFSRRGYVVLRYNKRGASFDRRADRPELLWDSTFQDLVRDARGALDALLGDRRAAAAPVVVYGHSEGTLVATHLAREANVDLLVLVGSANDVSSVIQYQYIDRYLTFFREAADGDRDGFLTLAELDRLDGRHGLGSFFVYDVRDALFDLAESPDGGIEVRGFSPYLDANGDGRLGVENEILAGFERHLEELRRQTEAGERGEFDRSFIRLKPMTGLLRKLDSAILVAHGDLDVWNHPSEAEAIAGELERLGRSGYRHLRFPNLGHSLSRSAEYFSEDGGLTIHDNPTLNAPSKRTMRRLQRSMKELLAELGHSER